MVHLEREFLCLKQVSCHGFLFVLKPKLLPTISISTFRILIYSLSNLDNFELYLGFLNFICFVHSVTKLSLFLVLHMVLVIGSRDFLESGFNNGILLTNFLLFFFL